jgi:CHAD domain-containing protein
VAKPQPIPGLDCEQPFSLAAAEVVEVRAAEVLMHSEGVLDVENIERLHDMRVATRRLRAAMETFRPCFPRKRFKSALKEVKAIADALGERRDRDVSIDALVAFAAEIGEADRVGVETLIGTLREEQQAANEALGPYVAPARLTALRTQLDELVAAAREKAPVADEVAG